MIYEGEYLNGLKNGKGKDYNSINGMLEFDGEYLHGRKWFGKITKYDQYKNLIFEGYYQNGEINGSAKEYTNSLSQNVYCVFDGEYLNGKKWNSKRIKIYDSNYESEYISGKEVRYGYHNGKLIYESELYNNKKHGKGKEYYNNGKLRFEGEYQNGLKYEGKFYTRSGKEYSIEKGNGKAKEYNELNTLIFDGEYLNGEKNGKVKEYDSNGKIKFDGEYIKGEKNGKAKEYNNGILIFDGEYLNGEKNGKVKECQIIYDYHWVSGTVLFEGEYLNGKKNGKAKEYIKDKLVFEGKYLNGKKSGFAKLYKKDGSLLFKGNYSSISEKQMKEIRLDSKGNYIY